MSMVPHSNPCTGGMPHRGAHHSSRLLARQTILVKVGLEQCFAIDHSIDTPDTAAMPLHTDVQSADWIASRVTDISRDGCGLLSSIALVPGMSVQIMFPGFEGRDATVAWIKGKRAGCAFATPLPAAILDYIIRMSDPAARG